MEAFHEQEEILESNDVIRFLRKVYELDRFFIYLFDEDGLIKQRIKYIKDMDIFPLITRALDYEAPQDIEIYTR